MFLNSTRFTKIQQNNENTIQILHGVRDLDLTLEKNISSTWRKFLLHLNKIMNVVGNWLKSPKHISF